MIVVDVETTGLDPLKHSIVSIGAIDFLNHVNTFYQECNTWPGAEFDAKALALNGFTEDYIRKQRPLEEVIKSFLIWTEDIEDITLAGTNTDFDRSFLQDACRRYGFRWPFRYRIIDLHSECYSNYLKRGIKPPIKEGTSHLDADKILVYVGLPPEPKPHNGLTGAKMEAEAFSRLIYKKQLLEEFFNYTIPEH